MYWFVSFEWNSFTLLERDKKYIILSAQEVIFGVFRPPAQKGNFAFLSVLASCLQIEIILPSITFNYASVPHYSLQVYSEFTRAESVLLPRRYIFW